MSIFGNYFGGQAKALGDGVAKTLVSHDPKGAMQAELDEQTARVHKLSGLAAQAEGKAQSDAAHVVELQRSFDQHLKAADLLSTQADAASDPVAKAAKQTALDKILGDAERIKGDLDAARTVATESRSDADYRRHDHDTALAHLQTERAELEAAIHEQERARVEAERAQERRVAAERAAGLTHGLNNHDLALQALHSNTEALHAQAAAAKMTADGLEGSSAADAEAAEALRLADGGTASSTPTTAADRLRALRGG